MTTFKNNAKYAELIFTYLDVAYREDTPLTVPEVLRNFEWMFKGGDIAKEAGATRLAPKTSGTIYPSGLASSLADLWPDGKESLGLREILAARRAGGRLRARGVLARVASYQMLTSSFGQKEHQLQIYSGMKSVYHMFGQVWDWDIRGRVDTGMELMLEFMDELLVGCCAVSRAYMPRVGECKAEFNRTLRSTKLPQLMMAVQQAKELIKMINGPDARRIARTQGILEKERWGVDIIPGMKTDIKLSDRAEHTVFLTAQLGPLTLRVSQGVAMLGTGQVRFALSMSDAERLHQILMSAASALVGICAQATVGTQKQQMRAKAGVEVAQSNISRIVMSSRQVPLGEEVQVCKGYRRAYTALLGVLAGGLCSEETKVLIEEAKETAEKGVLDIEGFLADARRLDAATALNAAKMFKICPAPDVSPGGAMIDRVKTIGNGNMVDPQMMPEFKQELRTQILRAYIRHKKGRLKMRKGVVRPGWFADYLRGDFDKVPSHEIHPCLEWEGDAEMPEMSAYDPANWKDSGLGADGLVEGLEPAGLGLKGNMITRLLFDEDCPMPGRQILGDEHVIKFFVKAEGHKDPARGIFSANLTDRQAQSWMERAVDQVAREHPSYMIGQEVDAREAKVVQLTTRPMGANEIALYYSFDISGWSAKMPAETQRISHDLWAELYGGHMFSRAVEINEGAIIYLNLEGYQGWYENTHSNLEGFNGKEMTMVLVALLSLSVRRWRKKVVEREIMSEREAVSVSALLFAYIDDGLSRIDLRRDIAYAAFDCYKSTVIETFAACGFTVEVSKCFPSDRFAIFLNEVYLAGRHVVHGVRAAMAISSEPTERHTSLVERSTSVSTGVRGAVMAGLDPLSAVMLMAYHVFLHLLEWVKERDPVVLAGWCLAPRAWGGLGLPNMLQLYISGSGAAFEESVATMQCYAKLNLSVKKAFLKLLRTEMVERTAVGIMTAPLSGRIEEGYMVDSRVAVAVRKALQWKMDNLHVSTYARRLLKYADPKAFARYAEAIVPKEPGEVLQEQMLIDLAEAHPSSVFSSFARRLEKSSTVRSIVGQKNFVDIVQANRAEAAMSIRAYRIRTY